LIFYIPDKKECDYIVEHSKQFFKKSFEFLGKNINVYHYKQANYEEFVKFNAWELRGLTFVNNERFLAIHKFFELNQAPGWMVEDLINKKVIKVQEKIDGTFLHPILIDGEIYFKSKLSFESIQAKRANEILKDNNYLKEYILKKFSEGKIPMFEYISPKTQVVMDYGVEKLVLIQVRDLKTGEYDLEFEKEAEKFHIEYAPVCEPKPLKNFLEEKEVCISKEGWVLIFEDMKFVKVKTKEYLKRHEILGDLRENVIIQKILNNEFDELEKILNKQSEKYEFVKDVKIRFDKKYNQLKNDITKALKMTKKEVKQKFSNNGNYEIIAICKKNNSLNPLNDWVKNHTKKLKNAKKFLEE